VENAVIYSDPGARVVVAAHVEARSDDDYVEITVSDTGIGIAPEDLERIFERFYRVDYARSRANGGTGLGLSIVKHIAASHGGDVSVWSHPGQGSTFTLRVPAHLTTGHVPGEGAPATPGVAIDLPHTPPMVESASDPASGSAFDQSADMTGSATPDPAPQYSKETDR
jgi:two-component system, OmpR family, sensor histidine kinase SenX3